MNANPSSEPRPHASTPEHILRRLDWQVIRRLDGLLQGDYRTLFYGDGIDFADLREYQLEDDIRSIDWNVTARMNSPFVRQFLEDREITSWFLLDVSPSMGFGPQDRPKKSILIDLTATLARLLTRSGNRVGAIIYNRQIERTIPPRSGRSQVLRLIHELQRESDIPGDMTTNLCVLLNAGLNTFKRRSLVFVISDFISEAGWQRPLTLLTQRHELLAIRLWDPREMELPDAGIIAVEDAETGEQLLVDTSDPEFRRRFYAAGIEREKQLRESLKRARTELFAVSTEEDLAKSIIQMAALRKRRRWHS
jgi:uncharacterized protein (DUF58 family)